MLPFLKAARVSGPSVSSALKALKVMPYVLFSPGWQKGRVGHSGPAPRVSWPPMGARSDRDVRLYFVWVALVTANAFWSTPAEGSSATSHSAARVRLGLSA